MHRVDEGGGWRGHLGLAILTLSVVAIALALVFPAFASAGFVTLEVEKEGTGSGTVTSSPAGINCGVTCKAEFESGKEVTLTATPASGSGFVAWEGCDSEPEGKCKITMDYSRAVTGVFEAEEPPEYSLDIEAGGNGEGEWECEVGGEREFCEEKYPSGTHVKIVAKSYESSKFSGFSGDCTGTSCTLTMDKDHSVTVIFNLREFTLTVKHNGTGEGTWKCEREVGPEECLSKYPWETEVTIIAIPKPGSKFTEWKGCDKEPTPSECEIEITEARSVTVTFNKELSIIDYTLAIKKAGTGSGTVTSSPAGINCGATCSFEFEEGKEVTLTATPEAGSEFVKWEGCASQPEPGKCKVSMSTNKTVTVSFNVKPKLGYTLTVQREGTGSGSVTSEPAGIECGADCTEDYPEGATVTLTATPVEGSVFKRWSGVEGGCALERVCKTKMGGSKVVKALFSSAEPAPAPEARGKADVIKRVALVRGGRALLALRCVGGPCKGRLELIARVKQGKKTKSLTIGKASFNLASGASKTIKVKLSGPARTELNKGKTIKAKVKGSGIASSTVKLKNAKQGR